MLTIQLDAEMVDAAGDTTWGKLTFTASDDPDRDSVDLRVDFDISPSDILMLDSADVTRALRLTASEREIAVAPAPRMVDDEHDDEVEARLLERLQKEGLLADHVSAADARAALDA